ncbi:MAG: metallophosphoesterase [Patescibacteria group bacterium]
MILTFLNIIFIYARFIEPNIIRIKQQEIKLNKKITSIKIAVFSDIHLGLFTKKKSLERTIKKINKIKADLIFIPGDFVWYLGIGELEENFECLKNLNAPVFAVLGNHDFGNVSEKNISKELSEILTKFGIKIIDNKIEKIKINEQGIRMIGLEDIETNQTDYNLIKNIPEDVVNIVLTHNADAVYEFPSYDMDLIICGHTHGGQVRIYPFYKYAYKYIARMKRNFDKDLQEFRGTKVFITTGIGMAGLPFRFLMPPTIDVLKIKS